MLPVATVITATAKLAPENRRSRYSRRSTIGTGERACRTPKPMSAATATSAPVSTAAEVYPYAGASIRAHTRPVIPAVTRTVPGRSSPRPSPARVSGTSRTIPTSATVTTGTLIRNTPAQLHASTSAPPSRGPAAMPTDATALHTAKARGRSRPGNTATSTASVAGITSAAPTPIRARIAISQPTEGAAAASADATPKTSRPPTTVRRLPYRSEITPAVMRSPAKTTT